MPKKKHKYDDELLDGGGGGGSSGAKGPSAPPPPPPSAPNHHHHPNHLTKSPLDERRALIAVPAPPMPRGCVDLSAVSSELAHLLGGGSSGGASGGGSRHAHLHHLPPGVRQLGAGAFGRVMLAPWEPIVNAAKAAAAGSPAAAAPPHALPRPPSLGALAAAAGAALPLPRPFSTGALTTSPCPSPSSAATSTTRTAVKFALPGGERSLHAEASALAACGPHPCLVRCLGVCWAPARGVCACAYQYADAGTLQQQLDADAALSALESEEGLEAAERALEAATRGGAGGGGAGSAAPPAVVPRAVKQHQRALQLSFGWRERLLAAYQLAAALAAMHAPKPAAALFAGAGAGGGGNSGGGGGGAGDAAASIPPGVSHVSVLHRDVKPANVLLTRSGGGGGGTTATALNAVLADLGIAVLVPSSSTAAHPLGGVSSGTNTPHLAIWQGKGWSGTEAYLDPLYGQLAQLCDRSDVYGCGLVMCELLLGARDDPRDARRVLACALGSGAGAGAAGAAVSLPLTPRARGWPRRGACDFARLALRASHHDREVRPGAAELAAALRALLHREGVEGWGEKGAAATDDADQTTICSFAAAPPAATTTAAAALAADATALERLLAPPPPGSSAAGSKPASLYGGGASRGGSVPSSPPPGRPLPGYPSGLGPPHSAAASPTRSSGSCVASAAASKLAALSIGGGAAEQQQRLRQGRFGGASGSVASSRGASPPPRMLAQAAAAAAAAAASGGAASPVPRGGSGGAGGISPSSSSLHLWQHLQQHHHQEHHQYSPLSPHHHHHHARPPSVAALDLRLLPGGKAEASAALSSSATPGSKDALRLAGSWAADETAKKVVIELWWPASSAPPQGARPPEGATAAAIAPRLHFKGALAEGGRLAGEWERRHHHQEKPAPAIEGPALYELMAYGRCGRGGG